MKKFAIWFMVAGAAIMIIGLLIWPNLNHVNMVDSNTWTININGIRSFRWPVFIGGIIFVIGAMDTTTWNVPRGRRLG